MFYCCDPTKFEVVIDYKRYFDWKIVFHLKTMFQCTVI